MTIISITIHYPGATLLGILLSYPFRNALLKFKGALKFLTA